MSGEPFSAMQEYIGVILSNLDYVQRELPDLEIDAALRQSLLSSCRSLARGVRDLQSLLRALEQETAGRAEIIRGAEEMIQRQVRELHEVVTGLRNAGSSAGHYPAVRVLFNESGANILLAYTSIAEKLQYLRGAQGPS